MKHKLKQRSLMSKSTRTIKTTKNVKCNIKIYGLSGCASPAKINNNVDESFEDDL